MKAERSRVSRIHDFFQRSCCRKKTRQLSGTMVVHTASEW